MFVGRRMGRAYYFLIEKRFVVHSRLRNKLATCTEKKNGVMAGGVFAPATPRHHRRHQMLFLLSSVIRAKSEQCPSRVITRQGQLPSLRFKFAFRTELPSIGRVYLSRADPR